MKRLSRFFVALTVAALLSCAQDAGARAATAATTVAPQAVASDARVEKSEDSLSGPLYATVGDRRKKIADVAVEAWLIEGGRKVAYSSPDGAGGYENEGHALYVYDVRAGRRRKVMSEYFFVTNVKETRTSKGRTALLVTMGDGGLGASYFAVVDPRRGEVFFRRWARLTAQRGDMITVGFWREDEWEGLAEDSTPRTKPHRTERHNLNTILKRRVIYNPPSNR